MKKALESNQLEKKIFSVAFIHNSPDQWVLDDREILSSSYVVNEVQFNRGSLVTLVLSIFRVISVVYRSDFVYYWFASHYSFLAATVAFLLRKPVLGVVSGYDIANRPDLNYGHLRGGINRITVQLTAKMSSKLLAVSNFTYSQIALNLPKMKVKSNVVYHGFKPLPKAQIKKKTYIVTSCAVTAHSLRLKGLDLFLQVAKNFSHHQFFLVGHIDTDFVATLEIPPNVLLAGKVENFSKSALLRDAAIYMQLSEYESFGCAMAEAMLNECYPLATRRGALPEVLGKCGRLVEVDLNEVSKALSEILAQGYFPYKPAREHIEKAFPLDARKDSILDLAKSVLPY